MKPLVEAELEGYLKGLVGKRGAAALVTVDDDGVVSYMSVARCDKGGIARLAQGLLRASEEVFNRHGFPVRVRVRVERRMH